MYIVGQGKWRLGKKEDVTELKQKRYSRGLTDGTVRKGIEQGPLHNDLQDKPTQ
jgi:hypothetical protein